MEYNNVEQLLTFDDAMELDESSTEEEYCTVLEDVTNCRTCLSELRSTDGFYVTETHQESKTIKENIVFCIPQMASTLVDTDRVCSQCLQSIQFCFNFIDKCLKVEVELLENINETETNPHETSELDCVENVNLETYDHVFLDHSYVPQPAPTLREETNDNDSLNTRHECVRCDRLFKTKNYLLNHIRRMHSSTDEQDSKKNKALSFGCQFCDKSFLTKIGYDLHLHMSHRDQVKKMMEGSIHICKTCKSAFSSLKDLTEHRRTVHGFTCTVCSQRFPSKADFHLHSKTHLEGRPCSVCDKSFKTEATLRVHLSTHDDSSAHLCHKCGMDFKFASSLHAHLKTHTSQSLFLCDECPSNFRQKKMLHMHKKVKHLGRQDYACSFCNRKFYYKSNLVSHERLKHSEVKPYKCEQCGAKFARADYLRRHMCIKPIFKRKRRSGLNVRKKKYIFPSGDLGSITCKLCNKVLKNIQMLRIHVKTHTKIRRYKCNTCNLIFTTSSNRDRHEKVHKDPSRGFSCGICFKRMETQEALDEHCLMSHESYKKYQCHACPESFARKYLLHSHIAEKHENAEEFKREEEILYSVVLNDYLVTG